MRNVGKPFRRGRKEGEEGIEGVGGETSAGGLITKGEGELVTMGGCPRLPELETLLLGLWRSGDTTVEFLLALGVSRHQLLQESHIGTLDRRHIVDMGEISIESGMKAVIAEEGRE